MAQPAARVGDPHLCPMFDGPKPHVGGPVLPPGKITVFIGGLPAATITDRCFCASAPDVIIQGAATVYIGGLMAARMGDMTAHGGAIVLGCPTVLIGGPTFTTPSFFAKFLNVFLDNLKFNAGLVVGFVGGVLNTVEGLINVLIHPIDTIKAIFRLAESIITTLSKKETWIALTKKETWVNIKNNLGKIYDDFEKASPYEKGKVVGKAVEFIAELLLVPEAKVAVAGEVVETAKFAEATRVAAGLEESNRIAKTAEVGAKISSESPSALARGFQGKGNYPGVDKWRDITLPKGKVVYAGEPGGSGFFTTEKTLKQSGQTKEKLWQSLQVAPHPEKGYRGKVGVYEVVEDTPAAFGSTRANATHGAGGGQQLYVPETTKLRKIGEIDLK